MNWKGYGRKQPWPVLSYYPCHLPGGTEENHGKQFSSRDLK
jgi:hypothetical protein